MRQGCLSKNDLEVICFFKFSNVFGCTRGSNHMSHHSTNVGPTRLAGVSVLERWGSHPIHEVEVGGLCDVEVNLEGLIMGIPNTALDEVPYYLQRHTVGVPESIGRFLRKVAREIMCYSEHNRPLD